MRRMTCAVVTFWAVLLLFAPAIRADWNVGDPYKMHYPQLPDLTPTGLDVNATFWQTTSGQPDPRFRKILADDWRCTESGPVRDIHIWGSWLNDQIYEGAAFKLSIHADIPKKDTPPGTTPDYSKPGAELWSRVFTPTEYIKRPYSTTTEERFYDPNTNAIIGLDHTVWQYNFAHFANPFVQQVGTIYWLDVQALVPAAATGATPVFGWKTTNPNDPLTPHFLDDAVYGDTTAFAVPPYPQFPDPTAPAGPLLPWKDMHYPDGDLQGKSIDLAFVITPEPGSISLLGMAIAVVMLKRRGSN